MGFRLLFLASFETMELQWNSIVATISVESESTLGLVRLKMKTATLLAKKRPPLPRPYFRLGLSVAWRNAARGNGHEQSPSFRDDSEDIPAHRPCGRCQGFLKPYQSPPSARLACPSACQFRAAGLGRGGENGIRSPIGPIPEIWHYAASGTQLCPQFPCGAAPKIGTGASAT